MTKFEVLLCTYYYLEKEYFSDKNKSNEYIYAVLSSDEFIFKVFLLVIFFVDCYNRI